LDPGTERNVLHYVLRKATDCPPKCLFIAFHAMHPADVENRDYGRWDPPPWPSDTFYVQTFALTSPTSVDRSFGIVRSRSKATVFVCCWCTPRVSHRHAPCNSLKVPSYVPPALTYKSPHSPQAIYLFRLFLK
jgi:hypothetical protein